MTRLVQVEEGILDQLVQVATSDAAADEVTAPLTPGPDWTPQRVAWLRAFHTDRLAGLTGPLREQTWAVLDDADDVVGGARLALLAEPGAAEVGLWLCRSARGKGVGGAALTQVLDHARRCGLTQVQARTRVSNAPALAALAHAGFRREPDGAGSVLAALDRVAAGTGPPEP